MVNLEAGLDAAQEKVDTLTNTSSHHDSLAALLERLPFDPWDRGKEFEKVVQWFFKNDPEYASELRDVWLWDDWPGRWGRDIGIDLVARTQEGKLWAIQAKCYKGQVPTVEIDKFISASARKEFSHRLLISTGPISRTAEYKLNTQEKSTSYLLYEPLSKRPFNWHAYFDKTVPALPDKKTPRPYQQKAIEDVIEGFEQHDRGRLIMACGTGKTLVGLWVSERLNSVRTLVLVPSLSLIRQTSLDWHSDARENFQALFVCSDQTVKDNFISHPNQVGPVTTDRDVIHEFLSGSGRRVVFCTYQSSLSIKAAQVSGAPPFDLVIADEAHHCAGKVDSSFGAILERNPIKSTRRLFMTATLRYLSGRIRDFVAHVAQADIQITSMDDPAFFGPEFHALNFGKAIDLGCLSDYQVVVFGVTDQEVKQMARNRTLVELFGATPTTDAESLAALLGTLKAIQKYDLHHVITFHSRIDRASDFSAQFEKLNNVLPSNESLTTLWVNHVSGKMTTGQRARILDQFEAGTEGTRLLSNARCLGEGVNVPAIDGIGFIDPKRPIIDIVQAVGRAIRKGDSDKIGSIVIPILIDDEADADEQLRQSRFEPIWNVLKALRAHDDVLGEELDQLRF